MLMAMPLSSSTPVAVNGELQALAGIEDFRHTVSLDGFFQAKL